MSTRVYSYGCRAPFDGAPQLAEQFKLGHEFYNSLTRVERDRRQRFRAICEAHPALEDLARQIEACSALRIDARCQAGDERMEARSRKGASDDTRAIVEQATDDLDWLRADWRAAVNAEMKRDPALAASVADSEARAKDERKAARDATRLAGLYSETTDTIVAAAEQAAQKTRGGAPPEFRRWSECSQQVAVRWSKQHTGGVPPTLLFAPNGLLEISPIPEDAWTGTRGDRRRLARTAARMRIGSDTWCSFQLVVHRPLPPAGMVQGARLVVKRVAAHLDYQLQITVREPDPTMASWDAGPAVGIDLGWRWQDAVRVAYQVDSAGDGAPLMVPNDIAGALEHAESLCSIRKRNFNDAAERLRGWLAKHVSPEWLTEATRYIGQWKAAGKLASLALQWRGQRFDGDAKGFEPLEVWRRQDKHLWEWEANERRKALARRLEFYRVWAAGIARRYSLVCIESFDLSKMARKPKIEEEGQYDDFARKQRVVSAPSVMRDALIAACARRGVLLVKVPCVATTITCCSCGAETRWDAAKYLSHRCECGAIWDQDHNAAINILRTGIAAAPGEQERRVVLAEEKANGGGAVYEGRFVRRRRESLEKRGACNPAGNAAEARGE